MGTRGSFPGNKSAGARIRPLNLHLDPKSKNAWSYISAPPYASMAWCLFNHRDNFTFIFTFTFWCMEWGRNMKFQLRQGLLVYDV